MLKKASQVLFSIYCSNSYIYCILRTLISQLLAAEEVEDDDYDYDDPFLAPDDDEMSDTIPTSSTTLRKTKETSTASTAKQLKAWTPAMTGLELALPEEQTWLPCYIISKYLGSDVKTWHVHILILMPSGVGDKNTDDIKLNLENDANMLAVVITWPAWVVEMEFFGLFSKEEQFTKDFVLREQAIKQRMSEMRPTKCDPIKSVARIPLPFQVEPNIHDEDWRYLGDKGARILFIDLKHPYDGSYEGNTVKDVMTADKSGKA